MEQSQVQNQKGGQNKGYYQNHHKRKKQNESTPTEPKQDSNIQPQTPQLAICSLCKDRSIEISMSCTGMHSYCFSCIKQWLVSKKELSCPECRKVCESLIKVPSDKEKLSTEFLDFLESVKIIPNPLKHDDDCKCFHAYFDNTCIYPKWSLVHFVENKEQLELYNETIKNPKYKDKPDDLIKLIKWYIDDDETLHRHHHSS
jgi:hypothetical protein